MNEKNVKIKPLINKYKNSNKQENSKHFKSLYFKYKFNLYKSEIKENLPATPTDDNFFGFLRALVFAHPFETSKYAFLTNDETNYSPFVINSKTTYKKDYPDFVNILGLRIYSNISPEICDLVLDVKVLIDYINSRYKTFQVIIDWTEDELKRIENRFKEKL